MDNILTASAASTINGSDCEQTSGSERKRRFEDLSADPCGCDGGRKVCKAEDAAEVRTFSEEEIKEIITKIMEGEEEDALDATLPSTQQAESARMLVRALVSLIPERTSPSSVLSAKELCDSFLFYHKMARSGLGERVVAIMRDVLDEAVQEAVCELLASMHPSSGMAELMRESGGPERTVQALRRFGKNERAVAPGMKALAVQMEGYAVGECGESLREEISGLAMEGVRGYQEHGGIFQSACKLIEWVASDRQAAQRICDEENILAFILGVRLHKNDPEVLLAGLNGLRALARVSPLLRNIVRQQRLSLVDLVVGMLGGNLAIKEAAAELFSFVVLDGDQVSDNTPGSGGRGSSEDLSAGTADQESLDTDTSTSNQLGFDYVSMMLRGAGPGGEMQLQGAGSTGRSGGEGANGEAVKDICDRIVQESQRPDSTWLEKCVKLSGVLQREDGAIEYSVIDETGLVSRLCAVMDENPRCFESTVTVMQVLKDVCSCSGFNGLRQEAVRTILNQTANFDHGVESLGDGLLCIDSCLKCPQGAEMCSILIEEEGLSVLPMVLRELERHASARDLDTTKASILAVLCEIFYHQPEAADAFQPSHIDCVMCCIRNNRQSLVILKEGLGVLSYLTSSTSQGVVDELQDQLVIQEVLLAVAQFRGNQALVSEGLHSLVNLADADLTCSELSVEDIRALIAIASSHRGSLEIQQNLCILVSNAGAGEPVKQAAWREGLECILSAAKRHCYDEEFFFAACTALVNIGRDDPESLQAMRQMRGRDIIAHGMQSLNHQDIERLGNELLEMLSA